MWQRLLRSKQYREEFAISMLKRMIPYQVRALRHTRQWKQAQLAEHSGLTQGVISRAEDPDYGNLTLTTIGKIAAGFDLAVIIKIAPFSELLRFNSRLSEREFWEMKSFEADNPPNDLPDSSHSTSAQSLSSVSGQQSEQPTSGQRKHPAHVGLGVDIGTLDQAV
jgi:transcriptional regulator with XRE-family HTH domain